ncbi:MAG TPA: hypothetical protein VFG62_04725 [Rhodopila sp.]|nr:hypothetical protein [Rhodopila sp.]
MGMPAKNKGPASDIIMAPDKMKPLLALSKQEPVQAAIGLTSDGDGLILLHKKMKPKKVLATLRAEAGKAKLQLNNASMRFGRAEVDPEYDASMVRFFINKEAPGNMRIKLLDVVRRVAYQKVEINIDSRLEEESEEDEGEGQNGPQNNAPQNNVAQEAETQIPQAPPPPPPPTRGAAELIAALQKLAPNIKAAIASHPELGGQFQAASQSVVALIKAADLAGAKDSFEDLVRLLKQAQGSQSTASQPTASQPAGTSPGAPPAAPQDAAPRDTAEPAPENDRNEERVRDFSARLRIINQDMRTYGLLNALADPLRTAIEATKTGSPEAEALLNDLERRIAEAAGQQRLGDVQETVRKASVSARTGVVALGKARLGLAWARSTYATVRQTLEAACEQTRLSMVGDGIAEDPETIAAVKAIGARLPDIAAMSADVEDALDTMIGTADPGARDTARKQAIAAIGTYRQAVDAEPILTRMQNTPAGAFEIRDALVAALDQLEQALAA